MIFVERTEEPDVLRRSAAQWLIELRTAIVELERLRADTNKSEQDKERARRRVERAQDRYRHTEIKTALVDMFHGKCAYCESKVIVVTYGQIEHFYPKRQYVERTFQWDNLLLSCDLCNNAHHKGTKFPIDENGAPLLIDPTSVNPEDHLLFSWDQTAQLACVYGTDERGRETVQTFDLNGDKGRKELLKSRSGHVKFLLVLIRFAEDGNEEAISLLQDACVSSEPYAAFARSFIPARLNIL